MIVIDTSVLVDLCRGRDTPAVAALTRLEQEGTPLGVPMICCQEVLQGARDEREWRRLFDVLSTQCLLAPPDPWEAHVEAARIRFDARRKGLTVRSTVDCLVAQVVLQVGGVLLHADEDFERIARVRPLETLPMLG